ncbi:MAG: AAA family ATPase [Anaerolineales bacterium]|nr:AAA family ATPase [Anaerolineales bacterium]
MTTIALAGKGGTGKTTVAALLIRALTRRRLGPVLAIDADPAANLNLALGLAMPSTVGDIREGMLAGVQAGEIGTGVARRDYLNAQVRLAVEEGEAVDLLVMGRPEGPGCYCAFNHMLRDIVDGLGHRYRYVVVDNEAGMEHLSRRTTRDVDVLLIVTDPTVRGITAAEGIVKMTAELDVNIRQSLLVVNRALGPLTPVLHQAVERLGIPLAATIPADPRVGELDADGRPLVELEPGSPAARALDALAERVFQWPAPV